MGYLIKYDDIRHVREKSDPDIGKAVETLTKLKKKIEELNSAQSFRGKSAESIKKYMQEVHFSLIGSIIGLLQLYSSKLLLYCDDYYQYDSDKHAIIPEDVIDFLLSDVPKRIRNFESCCSYFSDDVRSISDLFDPNNPDITCIEREMKYINEELISYNSGVKYHENLYKNVSDMEKLLNSINTSINEYDSKARSRSLTYNQGDYFKSENTASLFNNYKVSMEYFNQRNFAGKLEAANNHQAEVYKEIQKELEAQARKQKGVWGTIGGVIIFAVGVTCVILSFGAATPIVVAAGAFVGTITTAYGASDIVSGGQDIYYGSKGDMTSETLNDLIISDIYDGDEKKYNRHKQFFLFATSAFIPIGKLSQAGTLTVRTGSVVVGQEVAGVGVGYGTDWLSKKAGLNASQSIILGMITSYGTSKGLNALDTKFNVSGINNASYSVKVNDEGGRYSYKEIKTTTAEETNQWFIDNVKKDYKPPYKLGTKVTEIELSNNSKFVRVYDNLPDGSGMYGSWVMRAEDIEGLTPLEIQNKFALPNKPIFVCDVQLDAGTHLRIGEVNPIEGWGNGGGIQYDLIGQRVGKFENERLLEVN